MANARMRARMPPSRTRARLASRYTKPRPARRRVMPGSSSIAPRNPRPRGRKASRDRRWSPDSCSRAADTAASHLPDHRCGWDRGHPDSRRAGCGVVRALAARARPGTAGSAAIMDTSWHFIRNLRVLHRQPDGSNTCATRLAAPAVGVRPGGARSSMLPSVPAKCATADARCEGFRSPAKVHRARRFGSPRTPGSRRDSPLGGETLTRARKKFRPSRRGGTMSDRIHLA